MTHTLLHKSVLTPPYHYQNSIYVPSISHKDLAHIPDPSKCHQAGLSICPTSHLPNLRLSSQFLTHQPHVHWQCSYEPHNPLSRQTLKSMLDSFAQLQMDSSPPSPTTRPMPPSNTNTSLSRSNRSKIVSFTTKKPSNEPLRGT